MSIKWTGGHNDSGILRKSEFKEKKEELFVFGYTCKLFRDDVRALHIDQGKHLIPWMGDDTLKIDRYDARGALHDLSALEAPPGGYDWRVELSKAEQDVELLCDEERYRAFHTDEDEEEMYKEEELKRLHAAGYGQVGFNYDVPAEPEPQTQSTEVDEPFVPTSLFQSLLPADVVLPEAQKQNAIIEKTAMFIATQGAQMEILIKAKQRDNPQFQFLNRDSNLHSYYLTLINLVKSGKWPEKKEEMVEESHPENNEYLHPSLASTAVIESAPSIPSIQYRPSADCDYTMLMCKMLDEPFAGEVAPPGVEPPQPNYAPHHIARAPVLYRMQYEAPGVQYQQPSTPTVQYQQQPLYYQQQQQQPAPSTAGSPTKSTGLSLMKHYNTDSDSDSDTDSSSDSKDQSTILSPPPEVQVVVDKMATYVARNGDEFAEIVRGKNDPRFTFLEPDNEYHAYYKKLMQEKRAELNGKTVKRKESKAPVSFSIKKQKEPEPILPKPALPYESSTDEDEAKNEQQTEKDTTTEVKEPPKLYPQIPILNNMSQVVYKMEQIGSNDLPSVKTIDTGMKMLPNTVAKPIKPEVIKPEASETKVSEPKVEKVEEKTQQVLEKQPTIEAVEKKEKSVTPDERKVEKIKERHKENSDRHSRKVERESDKSKHRDHKREYRSRSRDRENRELRRVERSSERERRREKEKEREREKEKRRRYNEELESEVISLVDNSDDLIDLTGDQSDCKVSSTVVSPLSKADKAARRKRAAEFLRRAGVDPSAAALPTSSLASAMVDTLESLRKKRAEEEETRRRRDKRRHRDRRGYDDETDKSHRKSKRSKNRSSEDESDYDSSKRKKRKRDKKHSSKGKKKRRREAEVEDEDPQIPLNIDLTNTLKELRTSSPTKELVLQAVEEKCEKQRSPGDSEEVKRRKKKREDREYSEGEWSSDSDSDSASDNSGDN